MAYPNPIPRQIPFFICISPVSFASWGVPWLSSNLFLKNRPKNNTPCVSLCTMGNPLAKPKGMIYQSLFFRKTECPFQKGFLPDRGPYRFHDFGDFDGPTSRRGTKNSRIRYPSRMSESIETTWVRPHSSTRFPSVFSPGAPISAFPKQHSLYRLDL